jgi:hypothetical protein
VDEVTQARDPEEERRVEDVRADDLRGRQREDEQHHEGEERPAPDGREADDEPAAGAERDRDRAVASGHHEGRVARLHAAGDEGLREKAEPADDERGADDLRGGRLDVVAVPPSEPLGHLHTRQRHRRRRNQHPQRHARVHRAETAVPHGAEGLEDGAVQDVRTDGERRLEPEEQDQQRRQERAAAHARHADEEADEQPGKRESRIHYER